MRSWLTIAAALALLPAGVAAAQDAPAPSVAGFLADYARFKAETDKPEAAAKATRLMQVVADAAKRYKAELDAATKAGTPPRACPVKGSSDTFGLEELVVALDDLPEAKREGPFDAAFFDFLDKRHPCGG